MPGKKSRARRRNQYFLKCRTRDDHAERLRGLKESREGIAKLQTLWPAAFPQKSHLVRPLARGVVQSIAKEAGWSWGYARGVVSVWKARNAYCEAVLRHDRRYNLAGEDVDETVDNAAREQARQVMTARAKRRAQKEKVVENNSAMSAAV
jgi:sRNA-binding protein